MERDIKQFWQLVKNISDLLYRYHAFRSRMRPTEETDCAPPWDHNSYQPKSVIDF